MMRRLIPLIILHFTSGMVAAQLTAFPGAVGYGKYAAGGRGGAVIFVNNLNDDGRS